MNRELFLSWKDLRRELPELSFYNWKEWVLIQFWTDGEVSIYADSISGQLKYCVRDVRKVINEYGEDWL